ncbi:MAG: hypothetical protein COS89_06570 [Deltaproteobacteria bacterium CG07_land_8_20_14_0_80_38_7]|nr:MAG: hypothetical protein COS89_06570 [Deltaproteobacteria bacterium CG07_land_8_20_14_0_80_38_7]
MAKPKYRLEALLTIKNQLKKKAEATLAFAIKKLIEAKKRLKELEEEKEKLTKNLKKARVDMKSKISTGSKIGEGNVHVNYLRKLEEDIEQKNEEIDDQKQVVEEAEEGVKLTRKEYIEACKELDIMEKHKELWAKKVRDELSKKEEREMEEIGNTIHRIRKTHGEKALGEI